MPRRPNRLTHAATLVALLAAGLAIGDRTGRAEAAPPSTFGTTVATGLEHTLVLRDDGTVWAFGSNTYGQLGTTTNNGSTTANPTPTQVPGLTGVIAVAAGDSHSLALRKDGTVWAFGANGGGQLGTSTNNGTTNANPTPTQVPGLHRVTAIAGGGLHSLVLRDDGTVWGFGFNNRGQLGSLSSLTSAQPILGLTDVTSIAAGQVHSAVVRRDGTVWTFGGNSYGQLGISTYSGTMNAYPTPTQVPGITGAVAVAAQWLQTLVLRDDGTVWGFGNNGYGQLGNRSSSLPNHTATQVAGITGATAIAAGRWHTLARRSNGEVWAFGRNELGQLGSTVNNGTLSPSPVPAPVTGLTGVVAVAAGELHSVTLRSDGTVSTFGANGAGQLGTSANSGTTDPTSTPTTVAGLTAVAQPETFSLLRVITSPALPSQISINGSPTNTWGTWVKIPSGTHEVCFSDVPGYTTPSCQNVSTTVGTTTTVTGAFTRLGSLRVITSPPVPSTISVDGIPRNDWGVWTDLPAGTHTVCFGPVGNMSPPSCEQVTLTAGALTTITGTFTPSPGAPPPSGVGTLRIGTSPAVPTRVIVDGQTRDSWGAWFKIAPGSHQVCFTDIEGFTTPSCQSVNVSANATTTLIQSFPANGFLRVVTSPAVPATISIDGTVRDDWGLWTDLAPGTYTVCFGTVPGFTAPACQQAIVAIGTLTTITGTYT